MARYVIGDIHGCIDELDNLLAKLSLKPSDEIGFVGDLVDKGPDSGAVVKLVKQFSEKHVVYRAMGNHDNKHMRYHKHELKKKADPSYVNPMKPSDEFLAVHEAVGENMNWLTHSVPLCFQFNDFLIVHGGIEPRAGVVNERSMFMRTCTPEGAFLSLSESKDCPNAVPWHSLWRGPQHVIFGHIASEEPVMAACATGIDTGCVHGGKLTALKLDDMSFISVKAVKQYCPPFEE
jgi:hypothetical protein